MTNLDELKNYWQKKYPTVFISLWENSEPTKYVGMMMSSSTSLELSADTFGELISQGEAFLRNID